MVRESSRGEKVESTGCGGVRGGDGEEVHLLEERERWSVGSTAAGREKKKDVDEVSSTRRGGYRLKIPEREGHGLTGFDPHLQFQSFG